MALTTLSRIVYTGALKPIFFRLDPESVHVRMAAFGESLGKSRILRRGISRVFSDVPPSLSQSRFGLTFRSPIGLAAGFDYEARLTQILPAIGMGFGTVGTVTKEPFEGNPAPRLGRLPRSRSLLVNKGFKNLGIGETLSRLQGLDFSYPVGLSIGKTNSEAINTEALAVTDITEAFAAAEQSGVPFGYYELNISCPNLAVPVEFYEPKRLEVLLSGIGKLSLSKPLFVKMPISKSDDEIRAMLDVIVRYPFVKGVILGNLSRDRANPALVPEEVADCGKGNFSGVPCRKRSDELVSLAYRGYGKRLFIIGCGGVFTAEDAYRKIRLGASLVQLITGLIFEGPQLPAEINRGLAVLLRRDGFPTISEAVGADV